MEMRLLATASTSTTVPSSPHRFFVSRNASPCSPCCNSLSLLLPARVRSPRSIGPRLGACASAGDEFDDSFLASGGFPRPISVKIPFGDRHILVETGHMGRQASGAYCDCWRNSRFLISDEV